MFFFKLTHPRSVSQSVCLLNTLSSKKSISCLQWLLVSAFIQILILVFNLCIGHDCLGAHRHRIGIRPDPYCMLCSIHEPMDRNHLGRRTALFNRTECEGYWEARTKMMEN